MAEEVMDNDHIGESSDDVTRGIENAKNQKEARNNNLKSVTKNAGGKMLAVGVIVVASVAGGYMLMGHKTSAVDNGAPSSIDSAPRVNSEQKLNGSVSDNYAKLQHTENDEGSKNAAISGTTHIDSILPGQTVKIDAALPTEAVAPLPMPSVSAVQSSTQPIQQEQSRSSNGAVQRQMEALMSSWEPSRQASISFSDKSSAKDNAAGASLPAVSDLLGFKSGPSVHHKVGDQLQAVLTLAANSDEPGVVAARIVYGKYKGALVTGSFTTGLEAMSLKFNLISVPWADKSIKLNAIAIDPETGSQAIAKEVDNHYIERFALPFLAKFITGYGDVISRAGTTDTNSAFGSSVTTYPKLNGKEQVLAAVGDGASAIGTALNRNANRKVTVKIPANTPISLMLMDDVDLPIKPNNFEANTASSNE